MYLDELTMDEFKEKVNEDSIVILPLGAVEEHGAHLPLCTDSIQPEYIAEEVAKLTNALIAPPIRYGHCSSTRNFPGTLSLSFDTIRYLIYDILSELIRQGFRKIVVLSGHAGRAHMTALRLAAKEIIDEHDVKLLVLSDYEIAYTVLDEEIVKNDGHSGLIETARMLAIREDLVKDKDKRKAAHPKFPKFMILKHPEKYFPSGVMGDPTRATKEKGKEINEIIVKEMVKLIRKM